MSPTNLSLMTFALVSQIHIYLLWGQRPFSIVSQYCLKCESAGTSAISVIVQLHRLIVHSITWMLMPKPGTGLHSSWAGGCRGHISPQRC